MQRIHSKRKDLGKILILNGIPTGHKPQKINLQFMGK